MQLVHTTVHSQEEEPAVPLLNSLETADAPETPSAPALTGSNTAHPSVTETVLVNGKAATCLYDTGLTFEAVIKRSLVDPADLLNETVELQGSDRSTPAMTLRLANVTIQSRYVSGTIKAAVMNSPLYDVVLGGRHVFLGTPTEPVSVTAVQTRAQPQQAALTAEVASLKEVRWKSAASAHQPHPLGPPPLLQSCAADQWAPDPPDCLWCRRKGHTEDQCRHKRRYIRLVNRREAAARRHQTVAVHSQLISMPQRRRRRRRKKPRSPPLKEPQQAPYQPAPNNRKPDSRHFSLSVREPPAPLPRRATRLADRAPNRFPFDETV